MLKNECQFFIRPDFCRSAALRAIAIQIAKMAGQGYRPCFSAKIFLRFDARGSRISSIRPHFGVQNKAIVMVYLGAPLHNGLYCPANWISGSNAGIAKQF